MNPFSGSRERIDLIRQQLGISRWKNIALADFVMGNEPNSLVAVRGQVTRPGTVGLPNAPIFQTFEVPQDIREPMIVNTSSWKNWPPVMTRHQG